MSSFEDVADHDTRKYLPENEGQLFQHTVDVELAGRLVRGYRSLIGFFLPAGIPSENRCVDIGCGVGNITRQFKNMGLNIHGIEYGDVAVGAARRKNPDLDVRTGDITKFIEPDSYDFIFSREVYLFTRVNAFTDQLKIFSNLVASLKPGGLLMVSASRCNRPHCADYGLILRALKSDPRVAQVSGAYYEQLFLKFWPLTRSRLGCAIVRMMLALPIWSMMQRRPRWSPQYLFVVTRKSD